jgi:glucan endo-1,3-alpha-glucosidase
MGVYHCSVCQIANCIIIRDAYKGSSAYFLVNNKPLISTFSAGGFTHDTFTNWRNSLGNNLFFIPDFDETQGYYSAADGWWSYWGGVVDGLFSWEASWPWDGSAGGDTGIDVAQLNGAKNRGKQYMIGLSSFQYKDAYGTNGFRGGASNLPNRMNNILALSPQPDFVEVITWVSFAQNHTFVSSNKLQNDGPEGHYIGNIWPETNSDAAPARYANANWPHTGWQPLIGSFITAFKSGGKGVNMVPKTSVAQGAAWYHDIMLSTVNCPESKPANFGSAVDALNW